MRRLTKSKRIKKTKIINLTCIAICLSILIVGISGCSWQVISTKAEQSSLPSEQVVSSDKVSSEPAADMSSISSSPEQQEDTVSEHAVFKVTELAEKDFRSVQATVQARKKLPFDGHFNKKMAIIDGKLIIADDSAADNVRIYQFDPNTLVQEKTIDISHCAVGFSDKYILIIKASTVDYYNGNLELKKTVKIKADSSYRKNAPRFWGIVVIDENHIAWQANDRSVSAMEVANGYEKNIKKVDGNLSVLTEDIYKAGRPNQIFVSGSAYEGSVNKDIKGTSGLDDDIIVLGDITQGTVIDYIYTKELNHACISTKSGLVYKLPVEVTARTYLAIDGLFPEFDKLYDLDNRKVYHFIDQSSIYANNFIASYKDNNNFYFIMFSLEDGKEINYLIKV
ncbi:hypothetical protein [Acetanaerobacterium elongatum]|uniref:Uncharacterized protein n=1 Tax=Acetanaerobacterium elongatum TaxID=258515 RepID=A0A1H0H563_9FIRM|nr:hypothetical protein [Acetanaerobacterium elongatum]SDO14243.1 hypothetical protein SAMN05192585_16110 [Acetanaerobacterium elongatum]